MGLRVAERIRQFFARIGYSGIRRKGVYHETYCHRLFAFVLAASVGAALAADTASSAGQSVVRAGTQASAKGPEAWFTGTVRIDPLFPDNAAANVSGAYVTFEPGARSAWHEHPAGQTLVVISGVGLTGTSDGKVVEIRAGDVVRCPPNVRHWHGAAPHVAMTHMALTGVKDGKNAVWHEKVSDAEYSRPVSR